jgi:phage-related protein
MLALGAALNLAAPAFSALAPVVIKLADVFGNIFMKALQMLPDVIRAVGDVVMGVVSTISDAIINVVNTVTDSIDRLANIDGSNLMSVGAGLLAVAGGLAAFGAANVLAGVGNLVSGFLSAVSGQATPVEQLMMLADKSQGMNDTAAGISGIGDAMKKFADISPDTMQAVNDFPWVRATAFVAAGGAMAVQGAKVYNQSKNVEDEKAAVDGQKNQPVAANTSMAVQNNNTTNTTVKPNVRNQESSQSRYLASRY